MKRFLLSLILSVGVFAIAPMTQAASLEWQDISSVIPARKNRPVWDVAYAAPYVYFTDGLDFSKSGYIARTDGKWSKNLTADSKSSIGRADIFVTNIPNQITAVESGHALKADRTFVITSDWPQTLSKPHLTKRFSAQGACLLQNSLWTTPVQAPSEAFCRYGQIFLSAWNGLSWYILIEHKVLYRLDPTEVVKIGRVRDYFTSMTSDGRGHIYFGGTISTLEKNDPTLPITAKLVKMTDPVAVAAMEAQPIPNIDPSSTKTATWTWSAPTISSIAQDGWTTYNVGSWNAKNITKIELFQNNILLKTCVSATQTAQCESDVSARNMNVGSSIVLKGKVTDGSGATTFTEEKTLTVTSATGVVTLNPEVDIAISNEFIPIVDRIGRNGSIVLRATARAKVGLKRIVFHVNGTPRSACVFSNIIGTQTCDFQVNGWEYPYNQSSTFTAQAIDAQDHDSWAGVKTLRVSDDANAIISANTISWSSINGNAFIVGASDPDGISRIDVYVNDVIRQTCTFPSSYGSRECSAAFQTVDFTNGSAMVKGKITDSYGHEAWSESKTIKAGSVNASMILQTQNVADMVTFSNTADDGFLPNGNITLTAIANRVLGVDVIEIRMNNVVVKTCSVLNKNGALEDVPVQGTVRLSSNLHDAINFPAGTTLTTSDGRNYITLEDAIVKSDQSPFIHVVSGGNGQGYNLAVGTIFHISSIDSVTSLGLTTQAVDGFTGGRDQISANNAQCSTQLRAPLSSSFTYGTTMMNANKKVVWIQNKINSSN
ncbi:hypothetical protein IT408_00525 [Candidatus Uhrbacteria bacterium]|nr:hypothetical protein [Candidatus Uhrbacteria bacterium]